MTLSDQLKALKGKLNAENDLGGQKDTAKIMELEDQISELNSQILAEEEQQRVQVQEEKVASITLPYDFSKVFDDERANDIILELLQDMRRQDFAEHNQEISELVAAHREEMIAAAERERELQRQNDELQTALKTEQHNSNYLDEQSHILLQKVNNLTEQVKDAESKRDAAVTKAEGLELLVSEKDAHISKLRDEIAIGAVAAVNVVEISPTDRLAKLIEESKQAKVKSALDIALENATPFRGKVITDGTVAPLVAPEVTPFQPVNQTSDTGNQLVTGPVSGIPTEDQVDETFRRLEEVQAVPVTVVSGDASEVGKSVEERLAALEKAVFGA